MASFFDQAFDPSQYGNIGGLSPEIIRMLQGLMPQGGAQFPQAEQMPAQATPAMGPPVSGPQMPFQPSQDNPERDFFNPASGMIAGSIGSLFNPQGGQPQMPPIGGPSPMGQSPQAQAPEAPQQPGGGVLGTLGQQGGGLLNSILGGAGNLVGDAFKSPALRGGVIGNMFVGAEQRRNQQMLEQAIQARGGDPALAKLAALDPEFRKTFGGEIFGLKGPEIKELDPEKAQMQFNPNTRKWEPMSIGTPGANVPKPPAGYQWADPNDKSKGYSPVAGGPATHLPAETAGRLAMMNTAQKDMEKAKIVFARNWGTADLWKEAMARAGVGMLAGDIGTARRSVRAAIEGALRAMTGAAAPETEVSRYEDMFMPTSADDKISAAQKLNLLNNFINEARSLVTQGRQPTTGPSATPTPSGPAGYRVLGVR